MNARLSSVRVYERSISQTLAIVLQLCLANQVAGRDDLTLTPIGVVISDARCQEIFDNIIPRCLYQADSLKNREDGLL